MSPLSRTDCCIEESGWLRSYEGKLPAAVETMPGWIGSTHEEARSRRHFARAVRDWVRVWKIGSHRWSQHCKRGIPDSDRSEERRVGKECRCRGAPDERRKESKK